ncbi:putative RNA binding protein Rnp24 [Aspergillus lucknowensis]|uniref:RRM domain-containing protein n=1 Tax=Aspergillus lucknowensis TaxID=176173 RepID=A0ABR4LF08_9EURO
MGPIGKENQKKRKLLHNPEIEIDVSAPEPPSKKALRKAKKKAANVDMGDTAKSLKPRTPTDSEKPAEPQSASQKRSDYGIWIGNLGFAVTKDDLRRFFTSNCSFTDTTITRIHLPHGADRHGKAQNKGFAYVDFSNPKAVKEALELSEQLLSGRRVLIKEAKNFQGRPEKQEGGKDAHSAAASGRAPSKRLFVGNLGFDATKEILEQHFSKCGTVASVHLATFQDSGKCKGYAWVEFEDLSAAEAAVKGFKLVTEDDEDESEPEPESRKRSKPHKPRPKKVWVNQLLGRRMRIEFAEDATTRYNKRFGKNGEKSRSDATNGNEAELGDFEEDTGKDNARPSQTTRVKPAKPDYSRYDQSTVQKLSGAIVEARGKKTTFD